MLAQVMEMALSPGHVPVPAILPPRSIEAPECAGVLCMVVNYKPQEQFSSFKL